MTTLGERLRSARLRNNLHQKDAASKVGISNVTLSQYEKGIRKPDPDTLGKLAEVYDTSVDYLIGRTEDSDKKQDLNDLFDEGQLLWKGEPLSEEQLKPIADLLDMIIKERIPKYLEKKKKEEEEKKRGEGS